MDTVLLLFYFKLYVYFRLFNIFIGSTALAGRFLSIHASLPVHPSEISVAQSFNTFGTMIFSTEY